MPEMTAEDYESVERAQQTMQERGWRPGTLNEHVDGWASLVEQVEVGYSMTVDDYTNDLAVREWLDQVLPMLTEHVRDSLLSRLAPLDERFDRATVTPVGPLPGCGKGRWCRLPRRLMDELREDAIRMNLIPSEQESGPGWRRALIGRAGDVIAAEECGLGQAATSACQT